MKIKVNFENIQGKVKPMHAIGQPPLSGISTEHFHYLTEANIPYSRLHDVAYWFGGNMFVDIPNIFRDFDADETKEENYDFTFTDILIKGLIDSGCQPYFRLGVTIENFHYIKAYRIFPPKDFSKWARICEHIIRHYNEGWADGFCYDIKYWEIWNEPDNNGPEIKDNGMWKGTKEQFYELYSVTAKHLKACFGDSIKVGGYASCGFTYVLTEPEKYALDVRKIPKDDPWINQHGVYYIQFFEEFLEYIHKEKAPIDFFSWHGYVTDPEWMVDTCKYVDKKLAEYGLSNIESHVNEWSVCPTTKYRGTIYAAAGCAATMCAMHNTSTDMMCIYDGRMESGTYAAMFNGETKKPLPLYFSLKAFGELYTLGSWVKPDIDGDGIYAQAATDGDRKALLLVNNNNAEVKITTNLEKDMKAYLIDEESKLDPIELDVNDFMLKPKNVILFRNYGD